MVEKNKAKKSRHKKSVSIIFWVFLFLILLLLVIGLLGYNYLGFGVEEGIPVILTEENFPAFLQQHKIINDLPEDSDIALNIGGQEISIEGNEVSLSHNEDAEIIINADKSLIDELNKNGYGAIKEAIKNGEITIETEKSAEKLAKKYASTLLKNVGFFKELI
ncbi:MAG: hypothetical protein Q8P57_02660 [Candidatus Pacearchaeota archaeon]|nr:hypothetical protein [Candidatus Pacearchaeota archaeon]